MCLVWLVLPAPSAPLLQSFLMADGMQTRSAETQARAHECMPRTHRHASTTVDSHARTSTRTHACMHARTRALHVHTRQTIRAYTHPARARTRTHAHEHARTRTLTPHAHEHARTRLKAHSCARTRAHTSTVELGQTERRGSSTWSSSTGKCTSCGNTHVDARDTSLCTRTSTSLRSYFELADSQLARGTSI